MPQIIAQTYEIQQQIGAGGGGIVYLGWHMRLHKSVVLKADRRKLTTAPDLLSREVDALKHLSHQYIPQVYDYVPEGDTVYTVMDYIPGESLDKPLERGERFQQAQVIQWACELLEALMYLHSRPPHGILHSDIKPANIMLTPEGDIRLIDYNIALALGEEGTVLVAYSSGYASPEHYGRDLSSKGKGRATKLMENRSTAKLRPRGSGTDGGSRSPQPQRKTEYMGGPEQSGGDSGGGEKPPEDRQRLLDARSDIYCLGATLYHLLTGIRPAERAEDVLPIRDPSVSPALVQIVQKAMDPDPDQRYQSAEEMRNAFFHLYRDDPRSRRLRRNTLVTLVLCGGLVVLGAVGTYAGQQMINRESLARAAAAVEAEEQERAAKEMEQTAKRALELVQSAGEALESGDAAGAKTLALEALDLDTDYNAQAQRILTAALGVYDLSDGFKSYLTVPISSEPIKLVLSPDGGRMAILTQGIFEIYQTETGDKLIELPAQMSARSDAVFLDDSRLLYAGRDGVTCYDLAQQRVLWTGNAATSIAVSADHSTAACVYRDESFASVYDLNSGEMRETVSFEGKTQPIEVNDWNRDPGGHLLALNENGSLLAVSFAGGTLYCYDLADRSMDLIIKEDSSYTRFEGGFSGKNLAFAAIGPEGAEFSVVDPIQLRSVAAHSGSAYHIFARESGIYFSHEHTAVAFDPENRQETPLAHTDADISAFAVGDDYVLAATADGTVSLFDRYANFLEKFQDQRTMDLFGQGGAYLVTANYDVPEIHIRKLRQHSEALRFSYDPTIPHSEARVSNDWSTVMLFQYDRFSICHSDGSLVASVEIPNAAQVYDTQYRRDADGCYLEVRYYDGTICNYSAADGKLLSQASGARPDHTLYEEFYTDAWKISRGMHDTAQVYDRATDTFIGELPSDSAVTYVTQMDGYVMVQYAAEGGGYFGQLLDADLQVVAELPGLCDILPDGTLVFDDRLGRIHSCQCYSLQELISLT